MHVGLTRVGRVLAPSASGGQPAVRTAAAVFVITATYERVAQLLQLAPGEAPLYLIPVGRP